MSLRLLDREILPAWQIHQDQEKREGDTAVLASSSSSLYEGDETQFLLRQPETDEPSNQGFAVQTLEFDDSRNLALEEWNRINKLLLIYSAPAACALIYLLAQNLPPETEAACPMRVRIWSISQAALLLLMLILGLLFEWQTLTQVKAWFRNQRCCPDPEADSNNRDVSNLMDEQRCTDLTSGQQRLWRTCLCSRVVLLVISAWMLVGIVWILPAHVTQDCKDLALYNAVVSLLGIEIIFGIVLCGWLILWLSYSFGLALGWLWDRLQTPPTASLADLESSTRLLSFDDLDERFKSDKCAICLCPFDRRLELDVALSGEMRQLNYCGHTFHRECIDKWLLENNRQCPLCRQSFHRWAYSPEFIDSVDLETPDHLHLLAEQRTEMF